jgi:hypothetical protein
MGNRYIAADERLREQEGRSFLNRTFRMLLLAVVGSPAFDPEQESVDDLLEDERNQRLGDVSLRVQVIPDPTRPFGIRDRILQFFVVEGSRDRVRRNDVNGLIYEVDEESGDKIPLYMLNKSEVRLTVSGEGFAVQLPYNAEDPEPAAPLAQNPPIPSGEPGPPPVAAGAERITSENVEDLPLPPGAESPTSRQSAQDTDRQNDSGDSEDEGDEPAAEREVVFEPAAERKGAKGKSARKSSKK